MAFDDLDLITVSGHAVALDGSPAQGRVTFTASTFLTDTVTGQGIFPVPLTVPFASDGTFSLCVPATNDPQIRPVGWIYRVTVDAAGSQAQSFDLAVPYDGPEINLFLAAPIDGSGSVYVPAPAAVDAGALLVMGRLAWLLVL